MYHSIYDLVTGPLTWLGFGVLVLFGLYKMISMYSLAKKKDGSSIFYVKAKYGIRSILQWIIPFGTTGWKANPALTAATFVFHICLLATPIFLGAHIDMWDYNFGVSWPALPDQVADIMTVLVIAACCFFAYRRIADKNVAFVTTWKDWFALCVTVSPFITGFLAYHQIFNYQFMIVLHVVTGVAWLLFVPFGRLSHAIFGWYSRVYIASEFQGVRHVKDW
ncbi:TmcC family electron transfer complex membrane anchor subunit [Salidesulfovibrio onnuriiensis]|uniref:TmcC family electron transfer complex membrane anchor subunit n=1 Tax=Salidesulfovibrio onnuriiensis TaxID=2583823 RepID=UPI0011CA5FFF|nr:nitrate reductase [Salidesulfovibrio onnuriiensis]